MECTYGDISHADPEAAYQTFSEVVQRTIRRGGRVIIPAFAVGRTQEIVYSINRMVTEGKIQPLPVYVDSPLAVNASNIFQKYTKYFDAETAELVRIGCHPALNFERLVYTQSVDQSKAINDRKGPAIIISASGMAETGRILHHLRNNIENSLNTVMIVGWQAPNTLGRRLAEREKEVNIFGERYEVHAEVVTIDGFSAHAGQDFLLKYAQAAKAGGDLRQIFLVHGEADAETAFSGVLQKAGIGPLLYPTWHESVDI
jgi:metallo-beta-lactamase family protein